MTEKSARQQCMFRWFVGEGEQIENIDIKHE